MKITLLLATVFLSTGIFCQSYPELVDSAQYYVGLGDNFKAEEIMIKIVKDFPKETNNYLIYNNLGTVQRRQGRV